MFAASSRSSPTSVRVRRYVAPTASEWASSCTSDAPRSWTSVASTTNTRTPVCHGELGELPGGARRRPGRGWSAGAARGRRRTQERAGTGLGGLQHDRREVEEHAVEQGGPVGVLVGLEPQRGDAALEVGEQRLVVGLRVGDRQVGADVPVPRAGRPARGDQPVEQVRRAQRGDADAVERGAGQLLPDQLVGVVLAQPARLAQHRRGRRLPLRAVVPVLRRGEVEGALLGLELLGLGQAALDGPVIGHVRSVGSRPVPGPSTVNLSMLSGCRAGAGRSNVSPWRTRERVQPADKISRPSSPTRYATSCWWARAPVARPPCWRRCWSAPAR